MQSATGGVGIVDSGDRRHARGGARLAAARGAAALLAALASPLAGPVPAAALHYVQEGYGCYTCHSLDQNETDGTSSFISRASRTVIAMRAANGGTTPAQFGCTYCHDIGSRARMRAVLADFTEKTSMHPVGRNFVTGADTSREYLSSWNSATPDELDCVDCHDVEGQGDGSDDSSTTLDEGADGDPATSARSAEFGNKYPEHGPPAFPWNPAMLRGVTAAGQHDPLCRLCHGSGAPPVKGTGPANDRRLDPARTHADGAPAASGGSGPIVEDDGTPLQPTGGGGNGQCRSCHDTHYSNRQRLLNDGHERRVDDPATPETPIEVSDCTATCHFAGDQQGSFESHGHGKASSARGGTMDFNCTSCHSVNARHDSTFPAVDPRAARMLSATPNPAQSVYGTSLTSVCVTCHNTYAAHAGTVGCLDCHDEHAEGLAAAGNVLMVPGRLPRRAGGPAEDAVFAHAAGGDHDYFILDAAPPHAAGAGVCDNAVCHAGLRAPDGTPAAPLDALMTGGHHGGGNRPPLSDCTECHPHAGPGGSFRVP